MANNSENDQTRDQASEEATDWLIHLQDAPDDRALRRDFEAWLARHSLNASAWAATQHAADVIARAPASNAGGWRTPSASAAHDAAIARPRPVRRRAAGLVALAAAACIALFLVPGMMIQFRADEATATAEFKSVKLDDGSIVTLAPESAIALNFSADKRGVTLLAGEAFFEVSPDASRPFRVTAKDLKATVLGTAFDVRLGDTDAAVEVARGRVRVDVEKGATPISETLGAGQAIRVAWNGAAVRTAAPADQIAPWRDRQLIAQDRPMADVILELKRYVPGTIFIADAELARRTVTGVYNLADPVDAVRGVARAHGAVLRQITPWLIVVSAP